MEENEEEIIKIRKKILARNPNAFQKKILLSNTPTTIGLDAKMEEERAKVRHVKG
jgi:hypothetical protein